MNWLRIFTGIILVVFAIPSLALNNIDSFQYFNLDQDTLVNKKSRSFREMVSADTAQPKTNLESKSVSIVDTSNHIIVKELKERKGIFSWRDSLVIPKRSAYYSLLFPGLGQINNKDYWMLPIVYGLMGTSVYFMIDNSNKYNDARREYAYRRDNGTNSNLISRLKKYNETMLIAKRDQYKKYLDMTVMLTIVGYGLQVIQANSSAHLKGFDISDNISMQFKPAVMPTPYGITPGLTLALNFK